MADNQQPRRSQHQLSEEELAAVKQTLYDMGALYAAMSGSGSTLFGLFDRPVEEAESVFNKHFVFIKRLAL